MIRLTLLAAIIQASTIPAWAYNYYVDSTIGNDANSGTSASAPFASFAPLTTIGTLPTGTKIGVAKNTSYTSELAVSGDNLLIEAYGTTGLKPVIDASSLVSSFTKTVGQTNVYQATVTLPGDVKIKGNAFEDASIMVQVASLALCNTTPGSCYVADWAATSTTLYVYPTGGGVPVSNGKVYRYSARGGAIQITGNNATIKGLLTKRNAHQDGSIRVYGSGAYVFDCRLEDCCRHAAYSYPGCMWDDCYFWRGRNDLESPGTANGLVINTPTVAGASYETRYCTFNGGGLGNYSGPQNHGGDANELFASITHTNPTFIDCAQCWDVASANTTVINPTFSGCALGAYFGRSTTSACTVSGGTGSVSRYVEIAVPASLVSRGNNLTCPLLSSGFIKSEVTSGAVSIDCEGDTVSVTESASVAELIRIARGSVRWKSNAVNPVIANPAAIFMRSGYSSQTVTLVDWGGNTYPWGAQWIHNGTTRNSLTAWKTVIADTGSVYGTIPAASFSDAFDRADENLEASASWTRVGGAAAQVAVRSNVVGMIGTTQTAYKAPTTGSAAHWVQATIKTPPASAGGFPIACRVSDQSNFVGLRWTTSQFQLWTSVAGTIGQKGTSSVIVPVNDMRVTLAVRGDYGYVYANNGDFLVNRVLLSAAALTGESAGIVARSTVQNPAIDDYSCGVA